MSTTATIYAGTADAYLTSNGDAVYADARSGTGLTVTNDTMLAVGQNKTASDYVCFEAFLAFDLSGIPVGAIIESVTLSLYSTTNYSDTDFTAEAYALDWGASVTTGDWQDGTELGTLTKCAGFDTSGWSVGAYNAFTSESSWARSLPCGQTLSLMLVSDEQVGNSAPTGKEYVIFASASATNKPKLVVVYTLTGENPLLDTNLSIDVDGTEYNASATGLSFASTMPGGFSSAAFRLYPSDPFDTSGLTGVAVDAPVTVTHTVGGTTTTLYEGVIANDPTYGFAGETAYLDIECEGLYSVAQRRTDFSYTFVDTSYEFWREHPGSSRQYDIEVDGRVRIKAERDRKYRNGSCGIAVYNANDYYGATSVAGEEIGHCATAVTFDWDVDVSSDWDCHLVSSDGHTLDPLGDGAIEWTKSNVDNNGTAAVALADYSTNVYAVLENDGETGELSSAKHFWLDDVRIHSDICGDVTDVDVATNVVTAGADHGLSNGDTVCFTGVADVVPNINYNEYTVTVVDADQFTIATDITTQGTGGRWARTNHPTVDVAMATVATESGLATATDTSTVGSALDECIIRPFATRADALDEIAARHSTAFDWGFWESSTFYCKPRAAVGSIPAANRYYIDAEQNGVEVDLHAPTERAPDYVCVVFGSEATSAVTRGTVGRRYRPSWPAENVADLLVAVLDLSDQTLTNTEADNAADQYLSWAQSSQLQGTVSLRIPYLQKYAGGAKAAAYARAGDYITVAQIIATDTAPLIITGVDVEVDSGAVNLTIGDARREFLARILAQPRMPMLTASRGGSALPFRRSFRRVVRRRGPQPH